MTEAPKGNILIVDDDHFLVDLYIMKFAEAGYSAKGCSDGAQALQVLRGGYVPDVVIYDIVMNKLAGFSMLETMRAEKLAPNAYIVALTNQDTAASEERARELGTELYIVKASTVPAEVVNIVESEIDKRNAK